MRFEYNKEILKERDYNLIKDLSPLNLNHRYLFVCVMCNYLEHFSKEEAIKLLDERQQLFDLGFTQKVGSKVINLKEKNKYSHNLFRIEDVKLADILWAYKDKDCLKYVARKGDYLEISVAKNQIYNFIIMLDELELDYNKDDILDGIIFNNNSGNTLINLSKYKLPFTPYEYQVEDAKEIVSRKRALIGHEMGLGKTFISTLVGKSIKGKKLVICPPALRLNWEKEIKNIFPDEDVRVQYSDEEYESCKDWTIIGYASLEKFTEQLKEHVAMFVDEAHYIKAVDNWGRPKSKRAKAVLDVANNLEYVYLLSGTPLPSKNKDLFNILKALKYNGYDFSSTWAFDNYGQEFCDKKTHRFGTSYEGNTNSEKLHSILDSLMVRRVRKDVLPDLKKQRRFIPLKPKFGKDYIEIEKDLWSGENYLPLAMSGRRILSNYKVDSAIEIAEDLLEQDQSVVIVTSFTEAANKLKKKFGKRASMIVGGMDDRKRKENEDNFQNGKTKVCILNSVAGGHGLTLTKAHHMIVVDYEWLPSTNIQVEDRINRIGQDELCIYHYLYCENSIFDKLFVKMLTDKSDNISRVVDNSDNVYDLEEAKNSYIRVLQQYVKEHNKD